MKLKTTDKNYYCERKVTVIASTDSFPYINHFHSTQFYSIHFSLTSHDPRPPTSPPPLPPQFENHYITTRPGRLSHFANKEIKQ